MGPGKKVVASEQAHYTHQRLSDVLGLHYQAVASMIGQRWISLL
jgi:glutamate/tyrosine decarboxylase-like PLP-dependent enzyme